MCISRLIMDNYLLKTAPQQRYGYVSNKIIEYMDSENLFEVNFVTLHSLDVAFAAHYNQGMLTCSTVRTRDSWQNDWSQGFKLCDQEELPCYDTCVKLPCQGHNRHSEWVTTHCWVQMCLSMSYMFIIQHYLRLLAPCCNPTNHLNQMP